MNRHLRLLNDEQGIAWLHFDHADSPINILSQELLEELASVLDELEADTPRGLIILSDKTGGFIAGADVSSFKSGLQRGDAQVHIRQVHALFERLAKLPLPTLALIHGFCLGGGLELALCCDYRVARDDEATRLAFPEVRLGIFPGYGGTLRSIECIGALPAMKLMLSGRSVSGRQALKLGLVDRAVPDRQLEQNAIDMIQHRPTPQRASWQRRLLNTLPARHLLAPLLARQTAHHAKPQHYPAPYALIDHWKAHGGNADALLDSEASEVSRLLTGETAQNLIRVFFLQERLKSLGGSLDFKPQHLHVVGGGIMGGDIAAWCALKGLRVTLQDRQSRFLSQAVARAHQLFERKLGSKRPVRAAMDRLTPDPKGYGIGRADVAIEAIYEDLEAKQQLLHDLQQQLRPDAIMATNTSSIPLEQITQALDSPQRLIGLHFFNPVAKMRLVEVVRGEATDPTLIDLGAAFVRRIDRLPLPVSSSPGFLVNRILMPYLLESISLLHEGVPAPAIDRAAVDFGMPMGPIELADTVGLDVCLAVAKRLAPLFDLAIPQLLEKRVVEEKNLGKKSGQGFYSYEKGRIRREKIPRGFQAPADLADRMILRLLNESVACLREGVVEDADLLDAGVIFGTGYAPFLGGPLHTIRRGGLEQQQRRLEALERQHGDRFHPDSGWTHLSEV
jgi:3-hydroxyacyl-CoA dehydrogenase/enoyl-CoA hydratase/3-hydroxybutyryl-CoA epimerase